MRSLAFFTFFVSFSAFAVNPVTHDENGNPVYVAKDMPDEPLDTTVYNGTRALPGELPEVGWIGNCTGTLVAPRVVFTAGHCNSTGTRKTFKHQPSGKVYSGRVTRHPQYNTNTVFNDYAFILLDEAVPAGSPMAQFDTSDVYASGEQYLMSGYGKPNLVNLYWGKANHRRVSGQDISTCGPSNLGSGDSGGSLMRWSDDRTSAVVRKIVGVNSRGGGGCSYFNRTSHAAFISFAQAFEAANSVKLCGVGVDCTVPGEPLDCQLLYEDLGRCIAEPNDIEPMSIRASCKETWAKFEQCLKD